MDEFSGIRATMRPIRGRTRARLAPAFAPRRRPVLAAVLVLASTLLAHANSGGHDPAPAPAAAPAKPEPPPPPPPRPRPPPAKLDGPVAAPTPKPRLIWLADRTTGLALGGFDPVAYFLDGRAVEGAPAHELDWGGTTWRFADEGSLAAFRDAPEVYAPLYGGRCAFAVAAGRPTEGSPIHFLIWHDRLLLFADAVSRAAFLADPDRLFAEAQRRWPALLADLP